MRTASFGIIAFCLFISSLRVSVGETLPWGEDKPAQQSKYPAVFRDRPADRLAAEEVALQNSYRLLVERIYGLTIDAETDVYDLVLASKVVDTSLRQELRGMRTVDKRYYDDGRVEVAVKVTLREVVEIIKKSYKRLEEGKRLVREKRIESIERENRDREIIAVGRGALKGSEGLKKIQAMRAAEADAYARISARVFGIQITGDTTVRDFALESDSVRSKVSVGLLAGIKFTKAEFFDNGECAATAQITIREVREILTRTYRRYVKGSRVKVTDIEKLRTEHDDLVITEVGRGTQREPSGSTRFSSAFPFEEKKTVIERVLRREIVVE